jgi:hypothetical protein
MATSFKLFGRKGVYVHLKKEMLFSVGLDTAEKTLIQNYGQVT